MSLPRYQEYKESGVNWLGAVPSHWTLPRLKYIAKFSGGGTPSRDIADYWNGEIPWVSPKDMKSEIIDGTEERITAAGLTGSSSKLIAPGHVLLVVRSGILKHTIPVAINKVSVALNQDMKALDFDPSRCDSRFFFRWVQGLNDDLLLAWAKQGATVESIEHSYLANTIIPIPPLSEQQAIATFLDREIGKIDSLIAEQEKLITLLAEKRQAAISHAVARGIDPNALMRDSGVAWLGKVPAHWSVKRMKFLVRESIAGPYGSSLTKSMYAPSGYRVYGQQQVIPDDFSIGDYYISEEKFAEMSRYRVAPDDVLISVMGTIGRAAVVPQEVEPGIINPRLVLYRVLKQLVHPRYLQAFLNNRTSQDYFSLFAQGTTMEGLNMTSIGELEVAVPPMSEQAGILNHIRSESGKIDALVGAAERTVTLLKERRSAIIAAAVTGQIDVRGVVTKQMEEAEAMAA